MARYDTVSSTSLDYTPLCPCARMHITLASREAARAPVTGYYVWTNTTTLLQVPWPGGGPMRANFHFSYALFANLESSTKKEF